MREESVRVCFGWLLHDIGKPVLRAGGQSGDHSSLGYAYLKKLWREDREILDCVRLHHAAALRAAPPEEHSPAWIACIADNISAAADRRSLDTEESGFRRYLPLAPVFAHMNGEHPDRTVSPAAQDGMLRLPLQNLSALNAAQYQAAVDALAAACGNSAHGKLDQFASVPAGELSQRVSFEYQCSGKSGHLAL